MEFLGLTIFLSTAWYCDHKQFLKGYESLFFKCRTDEEKLIRSNTIARSQPPKTP